MQKLLDFIYKYKHWLLLLLIQFFSLSIYWSSGLYRSGLSLYAASRITGYIAERISGIYTYLNLRDENILLLERQAYLEQEIQRLRVQIADNKALELGKSIQVTDTLLSPITARIINHNIREYDTYYIVNKGSKNGVKSDMPVMSASGVVGAVLSVSEHYSIIVPIINPKLKLSCSVKGKDVQGYITTYGGHNAVYFSGVSLQAEINQGDNLVTSGYSYLYPEGLMVGTILARSTNPKKTEISSATYQVKLHTDFSKLRYVYILPSRPSEEIKQLEYSINR